MEPGTQVFGKLLGVANHIAPEGLIGAVKQRVSLFRTNFKGELTDEIWRLDLDNHDGGGPILELNRAIPGIKELVRGEAFMALVFPALMRQIYQKIFADGCDPDDDRDSPWVRWLRFGERLVGQPFPPLIEGMPTSEHDEWVDKVVGEWSRRHKLVPRFKRIFASSEGESK